MKIEEIKELIQALEGSTLTALELSQGDGRVRLERNYTLAAQTNTPIPQMSVLPQTMVAEAESAATATSPQPKGKAVTSPLVGVFYAAPSPEDAPFVTVGSAVKKGDVLCIVEAMKLMNEITAEQDGVITEICAENGAVVEYGQVLFYFA